jgi:poly(3-hydroxyalkanoate) synthetase
MKRMTIGIVTTNMLITDVIDFNNEQQKSKIELLIDDYITEELSEYCESYFDITTEKC